MDNKLQQLEDEILAPSAALIADIKQIKGDIMLLGIGGKMGPSMAKAAIRAIKAAGVDKKVYGVSRFSTTELREELENMGVHTIACDLLNEDELKELPQVENIIYLAGHKFGTTGNEDFTWAMNTYLPGMVASHFQNSNIVAFSSGNVLPFVPISDAGVSEETSPEPIGEYAQSCLGRERIFEYFSKKNGTPTLIYRLNYAVDFRYGVLVEIAKNVKAQQPIDLTSENVNVIWQGDANEIALRALLHCQSPAKMLNVTGPEILSTRWIAERFGEHFGTQPLFTGQSAGTALLNNASECHRLFGYPRTTIREAIAITAKWMTEGGELWSKDTHFQERKGKF
ncbi:Nucleoside-diphosphate-sugar epimerase [Sphingobacterium nematocida]|uniref:Nucleoside-diphosphate-sugar epimerase n=1 Tax=Sphingobacterium nematocida TaxID=1513896 RepID=A0A1T5DXD7_9SPHI|nr:NAD-dependent epimerase/dehydratase family protein [Sphingobacterium nematocida]SKB76327.1 Nucleoside-diphosphate-sugar epimerase [Sphingobacterium nematocida]